MNEYKCKTCKDKRYLVTEAEDHTDIEPCPDCTPRVLSCRNEHRPVTFVGPPCPMCELREQMKK